MYKICFVDLLNSLGGVNEVHRGFGEQTFFIFLLNLRKCDQKQERIQSTLEMW